MKLETKFNENDVVWFLHNDNNKVKFYEGKVLSINNWDKWMGFRYQIQHIDENGTAMMYDCDENNMYKTKSEITNSLFVANGTLLEPEVEPEAPAA